MRTIRPFDAKAMSLNHEITFTGEVAEFVFEELTEVDQERDGWKGSSG